MFSVVAKNGLAWTIVFYSKHATNIFFVSIKLLSNVFYKIVVVLPSGCKTSFNCYNQSSDSITLAFGPQRSFYNIYILLPSILFGKPVKIFVIVIQRSESLCHTWTWSWPLLAALVVTLVFVMKYLCSVLSMDNVRVKIIEHWSPATASASGTKKCPLSSREQQDGILLFTLLWKLIYISFRPLFLTFYSIWMFGSGSVKVRVASKANYFVHIINPSLDTKTKLGYLTLQKKETIAKNTFSRFIFLLACAKNSSQRKYITKHFQALLIRTKNQNRPRF